MKDGAVYEDLSDFKVLKKFMEDQLEDYNMEPGIISMNLVLFRDAIEHGKFKHRWSKFIFKYKIGNVWIGLNTVLFLNSNIPLRNDKFSNDKFFYYEVVLLAILVRIDDFIAFCSRTS